MTRQILFIVFWLCLEVRPWIRASLSQTLDRGLTNKTAFTPKACRFIQPSSYINKFGYQGVLVPQGCCLCQMLYLIVPMLRWARAAQPMQHWPDLSLLLQPSVLGSWEKKMTISVLVSSAAQRGWMEETAGAEHLAPMPCAFWGGFFQNNYDVPERWKCSFWYSFTPEESSLCLWVCFTHRDRYMQDLPQKCKPWHSFKD